MTTLRLKDAVSCLILTKTAVFKGVTLQFD